MAREDDLDFILCLGDYIYAESYNTVAGGTGVRDDTIGTARARIPPYAREAITLADYRAKYSLYRSDPALRKLHERFPMILVPDDHEVQDNYAGARGGRRPAARPCATASPARSAARKAFFESHADVPGRQARCTAASASGARSSCS